MVSSKYEDRPEPFSLSLHKFVVGEAYTSRLIYIEPFMNSVLFAQVVSLAFVKFGENFFLLSVGQFDF